jgi:hypothetical protein
VFQEIIPDVLRTNLAGLDSCALHAFASRYLKVEEIILKNNFGNLPSTTCLFQVAMISTEQKFAH